MKPEDLVRYAQQGEQQALPIIKEMEVTAGVALLLLAQYTQVLISGKPHFTIESVLTTANSIVALWQTGSYCPSAHYPFALEETLQDIKEGLKAKGDYAKYFQPFTPFHPFIHIIARNKVPEIQGSEHRHELLMCVIHEGPSPKEVCLLAASRVVY
jgi:hypothetical protein